MSREQALILLDPQVNMLAGEAAVHAAPELLATLQRVLAQARAAGVNVIFMQHSGPPGTPAEPESPGWQIHPLLAPQAGEMVIRKSTPNAFHNTRLQQQLQLQSITELIIAGVQTELGVDTTCRAAWGIGYKTTLIADGHSTCARAALTAPQIIAHHNSVLAAFVRVDPAAELIMAGGAAP